MEQDNVLMVSEEVYPMLLIPKKCTILQTECDSTILIDLNISSIDTEGNHMCIYSGFCNIKLIDSYDVAPVQHGTLEFDSSQLPAVVADNQTDSFNETEVWIDPERSPNVYNQYDSHETQECYSIHRQTKTSRITVEQSGSYVKNVYNFEESIRYSPLEEYEHKKFKKNHSIEQQINQNFEQNALNMYEEDEFECGVFLSQLPEEIYEQETRRKEEKKLVEVESQNNALKQLMSSNIHPKPKQLKTILYLGEDSNHGQTIQKIAMLDPNLVCHGTGDEEVIAFEQSSDPAQKKYQCAKCKQIFDHISTFRLHMIHHNSRWKTSNKESSEFKFMCTECGKNLKNQKKFEQHCKGHGNPELECDKCHKVFASKFTLRTHRLIHQRRYPCDFCFKSFAKRRDLEEHSAKAHYVFICDQCGSYFDKYEQLEDHLLVHNAVKGLSSESCETELVDSVMMDDIENEPDIIIHNPNDSELIANNKKNHKTAYDDDSDEVTKSANSVHKEDMSDDIFEMHNDKSKKRRKVNKTCKVCQKEFDRISDLKRHLIEHVVRSTLARSPVDRRGTLLLRCQLCQHQPFTEIDKYKAHLREHAKLTIYQCTFCNKSFSDSSNFSKHKKVHGVSSLQCDLCQRKFNSKKMITRHMEYHKLNAPIPCEYCKKKFHFESVLNKHIKSCHTRDSPAKFRCRFCSENFRCLKEKWDHEWSVHSVRKMVVDCKLCDGKFRKYSELKKHSIEVHHKAIPKTKKLN